MVKIGDAVIYDTCDMAYDLAVQCYSLLSIFMVYYSLLLLVILCFPVQFIVRLVKDSMLQSSLLSCQLLLLVMNKGK